MPLPLPQSLLTAPGAVPVVTVQERLSSGGHLRRCLGDKAWGWLSGWGVGALQGSLPQGKVGQSASSSKRICTSSFHVTNPKSQTAEAYLIFTNDAPKYCIRSKIRIQTARHSANHGA